METKNIAKTDVPIRKLLWVQVVFSWSISGSWRFINFHPQCHQGTKGGLGGSDFDQCYPFTRNHAAMQLQDSPNQLDFISIIWVWVNTYRYIFSGMNIHYQLFWGSLGTRVLTHPHFIRWFTMIFSLLVTVQQHTRPPPQAWRWGSSLTFPRGHDGTRNRIPGSMDVIVPS